MGKDLKSLVRCMYTGKLNDNVRKLKIATEELKDIGNSVMKRVKICEEQQQMKRLDKVQSWLRQADIVIKEAEDLFLTSSSSSQGLLSSSHKMEKKICKKLKEVEEIKSRGMFEVVAENVGGGSGSTVKTNDEETVGLEAVSGLVWRCLTMENTGIIGLYGLEGVGKTTVLTQNLNLEKIQDTIREKIGFLDRTWTSKTEGEKAAKIFDILSKRRFALFLDDVWEKVDLVKAGVPPPDAQNRSKVVFTTCSEDVFLKLLDRN
ncbi:hypothetical protein Bca4012_098216 [Brassica carinata]